MSAVLPPQPTTTQLVSAFAAALLPLAGPYGIAADGVMTAGLQFLKLLQEQRAAGKTAVTLDDLVTIASKTTVDLAQLAADVAAQQGAKT
jgi:hypothetical protein